MKHNINEVKKRIGTFLDALVAVRDLNTDWQAEDDGTRSKGYRCFGNYPDCSAEPLNNELLSPFLICRVCQSLGKDSSGWIDKLKELLKG